MKPIITVVDYGMGNLLSVTRALEQCGAHVEYASTPDMVSKAEKLVLPGVGAFNDGMAELQKRKLIDAIRHIAADGRPLLGICLGMQMLLDGSDEFGASTGLGLIPGWVKKLPEQPAIKLPHVAWSAIDLPGDGNWVNSVLEGIPVGQEMYFVHSFYADPKNTKDCLAETLYGDFRFCSAVRKNQITGCQFHPEKSGEAGLEIIRHFIYA